MLSTSRRGGIATAAHSTSTAGLRDGPGDVRQSLETLLQDLDAPVELGGVAPRPAPPRPGAMLPADEDGVLVER